MIVLAHNLTNYYGLVGAEVFLVSVLVTVPSELSVTVFSLLFTLPSLLTLVLSVLETVRSQPTIKNDSPKTEIAPKATSLRLLVICFIE